MPERIGFEQALAVLADVRVVAVLGATSKTWMAGHYVPAYLHEHGYRVIPVNPKHVGQTWWGEPVRPNLADVGEPIDLIDVFRRPEELPGHLDEILALQPLPRVVWLQLGIRHEAFARALVDAGIDVVQDRCTLADHRAGGLGRRA